MISIWLTFLSPFFVFFNNWFDEISNSYVIRYSTIVLLRCVPPPMLFTFKNKLILIRINKANSSLVVQLKISFKSSLKKLEVKVTWDRCSAHFFATSVTLIGKHCGHCKNIVEFKDFSRIFSLYSVCSHWIVKSHNNSANRLLVVQLKISSDPLKKS